MGLGMIGRIQVTPGGKSILCRYTTDGMGEREGALACISPGRISAGGRGKRVYRVKE